MTKKTKATTPDKPSRSAVQVAVCDDTPDAANDATARALLRPEVHAAAIIQKFESDGPEINALVRELAVQVEAVNRGDMRRPEAMLITQAHTLNELFTSLARRAHNQEYLKQYETYMRLALKAQSQCRTTIEALAEIKNPRPVAFVKQANIAHGPQQINNGVQAGESPAHENNTIQSNELSGDGNELLPDTRASALEGRIDTPVEAVGAIHRSTD